MRILVIGPGALGIPTAIDLHTAGHDVHVAVRDAAKADRLRRSGLRLDEPDGRRRRAVIPCVHDPATSGPYDSLIHTTKIHGADTVLRHWLPTLAPNGAVIPFQNGVEGDRLAAVAGNRFMECSVYWPATLKAEGHAHRTAHGRFVVGPWPRGEPSERHRRAAAMLSAVEPTQVHGDMEAVKWSKLAINAAVTGCGVVGGASLGELVRHRASADAFLAVARETLAVMHAAGIHHVAVGGSRTDLLARLPAPLGRLALRAVARRFGDARSSSAQSLARGERTEVDALNGRIVDVGGRFDVPTPVNQAVVETVHAIEEGTLQAGLKTVEAMMAQTD